MRARLAILVGAGCLLSTLQVEAFEKLDGYLLAIDECPAVISIRKQTNPDNAELVIGRGYELMGANKQAATHYQVRIEGLQSNRRWVEVDCGIRLCPTADGVMCSGGVPPVVIRPEPAEPDEAGGETGGTGGAAPEFVLAASWQPAFCETDAGRNKTECKNQTAERFDAQNFALHGLWPQPRNNTYCDSSGRPGKLDDTIKAIDRNKQWQLIDPLVLESTLREELNTVMPGTQSFLHRHEWVKHGTCFEPRQAQDYYEASLFLMEELNSSAVRDVFANNVGQEISLSTIQAAFDETFGAGAGDKVQMSCSGKPNRKKIGELKINLKGEIVVGQTMTSMADLLAAADTANNSQCQSGIVDAVGF